MNHNKFIETKQLPRNLIVIGLLVAGFLLLFLLFIEEIKRPRYDLLFAVDHLNDLPYSDPNSLGVVFRLKEHKVTAIFTGKWSGFFGAEMPAL